jgi:hypothetical protein
MFTDTRARVCDRMYVSVSRVFVIHLFNMEEASIDETREMRVPCTDMMTDRRTRPSGFLPVLPAEDADTRPGPGDLSILMMNVEALAPHARSSPRIENRLTV